MNPANKQVRVVALCNPGATQQQITEAINSQTEYTLVDILASRRCWRSNYGHLNRILSWLIRSLKMSQPWISLMTWRYNFPVLLWLPFYPPMIH